MPCLPCARPVDAGGIGQSVFLTTDLLEDVFRVACYRGHESLLGLAQPRFKILYESGAMAYLDGYYREAIGSFASALERFHEYWVRATLLEQGTPPDALEATWKVVSRQSERQFGAFLALYLRERGKVPPHIEKRKEFRNSIVHAGAFPSKVSAHEFAVDALQQIASLSSELQERAPHGIAALQQAQDDVVRAAQCDGAIGIDTIVGRATNAWPEKLNFAMELVRLDARRRGAGLREILPGSPQFGLTDGPASPSGREGG